MNLCSCMGPLRGDPYCYCEMLARGLEPTPMPKEEEEALYAALAKAFAPKPKEQT